MSTSTIACRTCKNPVAVKHHSGRIRVCPGISVILTATGVTLTCSCGESRKITTPREKVA